MTKLWRQPKAKAQPEEPARPTKIRVHFVSVEGEASPKVIRKIAKLLAGTKTGPA